MLMKPRASPSSSRPPSPGLSLCDQGHLSLSLTLGIGFICFSAYNHLPLGMVGGLHNNQSFSLQVLWALSFPSSYDLDKVPATKATIVTHFQVLAS